MTEEVRIRGGAKLGWEFWGWPLGRIVVSEREIEIAFPGTRCRLSRSDIEVILEYRNFLNRGVRIVHNRSDVPDPVAFFAFRKKVQQALRGVLEDYGFPVDWSTKLE